MITQSRERKLTLEVLQEKRIISRIELTDLVLLILIELERIIWVLIFF